MHIFKVETFSPTLTKYSSIAEHLCSIWITPRIISMSYMVDYFGGLPCNWSLNKSITERREKRFFEKLNFMLPQFSSLFNHLLISKLIKFRNLSRCVSKNSRMLCNFFADAFPMSFQSENVLFCVLYRQR